MNKALAAVFTTLLSVDGIFTYWAIRSGDFQETNPLMAPIADSPLFVIYKVATAVLAVLLIGWLSSKFPAVRKFTNMGLGLFSLVYVLVLASNLWEVIKL